MARKKKKIEAAMDESLDPSTTADVSEIGKSSNELSVENSAASASPSRFREIMKDFTIFDAFLLISLICITIATLRVFFAMGQYGGYFWDKPWNVTQ